MSESCHKGVDNVGQNVQKHLIHLRYLNLVMRFISIRNPDERNFLFLYEPLQAARFVDGHAALRKMKFCVK